MDILCALASSVRFSIQYRRREVNSLNGKELTDKNKQAGVRMTKIIILTDGNKLDWGLNGRNVIFDRCEFLLRGQNNQNDNIDRWK